MVGTCWPRSVGMAKTLPASTVSHSEHWSHEVMTTNQLSKNYFCKNCFCSQLIWVFSSTEPVLPVMTTQKELQQPHFSSQQRSWLPREKVFFVPLARPALAAQLTNDSKAEEPLSEQPGERRFGWVPASQGGAWAQARSGILDGPVCSIQ